MGRLTMPTFAVLICGFVFGWGLLISGMTQPTKVLGFLDVLGAWDPSLAVVMAAALAVSALGYAYVQRLDRPYLSPQAYWVSNRTIDRPLLAGAAIFGVGWGLVGLCPGPALVNVATASLPVLVFVAAMTAGMMLHDTGWRRWRIHWTSAPAAADG
jgi:uncharacterized membrane protein YedE/YeeE